MMNLVLEGIGEGRFCGGSRDLAESCRCCLRWSFIKNEMHWEWEGLTEWGEWLERRWDVCQVNVGLQIWGRSPRVMSNFEEKKVALCILRMVTHVSLSILSQQNLWSV